MPSSAQDLAALDAQLKILLPETYHDCMDEIRPNPMGSTGLKYDAQGRVAWNQIWNSFCDLAMAGGPPHKGKLLLPCGTQPNANTDEIIRGIGLVTGFQSEPGSHVGWVRVRTGNATMAAWLVRAITMENVAVLLDSDSILLPTSPLFATEKEVKSVIVTVAKTHHYWSSHMSAAQREEIRQIFASADKQHPLIQPDYGDTITIPDGAGWRGIECPNLWAAVWMMRALAVSNVLARRESNTLFVPTNRQLDRDGDLASAALQRVQGLAALRGIL